MTKEACIVISGLSRKFKKVEALRGIDLEIKRGELFGIVGPDGSGKTTLIQSMCAILDPTEGSVKVDGFDTVRDAAKITSVIGYMSQAYSLYEDLTAGENLEFFAKIRRVPDDLFVRRVERLLDFSGLSPFLKRRTKHLSGGMQKKLALCYSLLHSPDVLFLDEPTSGVDPTSRKAFWEMITLLADSGTTVFVTTHYLREVEGCSRVAFLHQGRIMALDTPNSLTRDMAVESLMKKGIMGEAPEVEARTRVWYNPDLKFTHFMIISMIVVAGMMVGMIHLVATMVREKETGTVEQLMITPLRRHEIIIAKLFPTITIATLSLFPSLLVARGFGLTIKGSIPLFFLASTVFLFTSMGMGVFVSTLSRNLQQALLITFFVLFPIMFLSGTMVPIESMPVALQYASLLSPVRYYMEITLGIFLKGVGLKILWPKLVMILVFGLLIFPLSILRLRRRMYE